MLWRSVPQLLLLLGAMAGGSLAEPGPGPEPQPQPQPEPVPEPEPTTSTAPCTASSTSGAFYDLRPDIAVVTEEGAKPHRGVRTADYLARGYDYNTNFTLNLCNAVTTPPKDVVGVDEPAWKNVSAYYEFEGKVYSLGQQSSALHTRGSQLVLQYTGGSPCGPGRDKRSPSVYDGWDSGSAGGVVKVAEKDEAAVRRKSATFAFVCDQDPMSTETAVSFIAADPDECAYVFKVRSHHACAGAQPHQPGSVGPASVFAIIFFIAVLVYLMGGIFYQRTVAHARGWRQLPNYTLWLGIWNFLKDMSIILTSSCGRLLPGRRAPRPLSVSPSRGRNNRDDENRLIDQLDEEWDD